MGHRKFYALFSILATLGMFVATVVADAFWIVLTRNNSKVEYTPLLNKAVRSMNTAIRNFSTPSSALGLKFVQ
jgi:hypothetical protein